MTTSGLTVRIWNDAGIARRDSDGYVNATAMCKANGKHLPHYTANERTKEYIQALASVVGIPTTELVQSRQGGTPELQGTWIHPRLAVDLARWISPAFAVWMDGWFLEAAQQQAAPAQVPEIAVSRSEFLALKERVQTNSWRMAQMALSLDASNLLDFEQFSQRSTSRSQLPPAWPCTVEAHAKAAVRVIANARARQMTVISARDVQRWRPFGRRRLTAHQARQFLREAAERYQLGVMTPGARRGKDLLQLAG